MRYATHWIDVTVLDIDRLRSFARGSYQRAFLDGQEAISGSTLTGKAKSYSGKYTLGLARLLDRIAQAGYRVGEYRDPRSGRRVVVIREEAAMSFELSRPGQVGSHDATTCEVAIESLRRAFIAAAQGVH